MAKYLDLKLGKKLKIYRFNTGVGQNGAWAFFSYTPYEKNPDESITYGQEYTIVISNIDDVLSGYIGNSPVFAQFEGKLYDLKRKVDASTSLKAEISSIIGEENIKIL